MTELIIGILGALFGWQLGRIGKADVSILQTESQSITVDWDQLSILPANNLKADIGDILPHIFRNEKARQSYPEEFELFDSDLRYDYPENSAFGIQSLIIQLKLFLINSGTRSAVVTAIEAYNNICLETPKLSSGTVHIDSISVIGEKEDELNSNTLLLLIEPKEIREINVCVELKCIPPTETTTDGQIAEQIKSKYQTAHEFMDVLTKGVLINCSIQVKYCYISTMFISKGRTEKKQFPLNANIKVKENIVREFNFARVIQALERAETMRNAISHDALSSD